MSQIKKMQTPAVAAPDETAGVDYDRFWMIVGTNPRQEGLVMSQLRPEQYETYRPMTQALRWRDGRKLLVAEPVFPNYIFVAPLVVRPERIFGKAGVAWVFPRGCSVEIVRGLKKLETEDYIKVVASLEPTPADKIDIGDRVRTLDGLLEFVVTQTDGKARVAGLSAFMNGNSTVMVPLNRVVKVASKS